MKKGIGIITAVFVFTVSGLAFAQMSDKGKEMMGMKGMCQSMMNKPSLVAVGDGVVVLSGKKMYKYDANLNLVKEVDIQVDEHTAHHPKQ